MSNFQDLTKYLLALKKEKKVKNFVAERKISLDVIRTKQCFALSAPVYSEDEYLSPNMRAFVKNEKIAYELDSHLKIDEKNSSVVLVQYVPYLTTEKPPRQILIEFAELALTYIRKLEDVANDDLVLLKSSL